MPDPPPNPEELSQIEAAPADDGPPSAPPSSPAVPTAPTARTRISGTWVGVIIAALVLALLLVFILQNTKSARISYFTATVTMPLGVALLLGTIGGVLLSGVIASMRIWQLRNRLTGPVQNGGRGRGTRRLTRRRKAG
jgi:putative membrane protein